MKVFQAFINVGNITLKNLALINQNNFSLEVTIIT